MILLAGLLFTSGKVQGRSSTGELTESDQRELFKIMQKKIKTKRSIEIKCRTIGKVQVKVESLGPRPQSFVPKFDLLLVLVVDFVTY